MQFVHSLCKDSTSHKGNEDTLGVQQVVCNLPLLRNVSFSWIPTPFAERYHFMNLGCSPPLPFIFSIHLFCPSPWTWILPTYSLCPRLIPFDREFWTCVTLLQQLKPHIATEYFKYRWYNTENEILNFIGINLNLNCHVCFMATILDISYIYVCLCVHKHVWASGHLWIHLCSVRGKGWSSEQTRESVV